MTCVLLIYLIGCLIFAYALYTQWPKEDDLVLISKLTPELFVLTCIVTIAIWPLQIIYLIFARIVYGEKL